MLHFDAKSVIFYILHLEKLFVRIYGRAGKLFGVDNKIDDWITSL